MTGLKIALVAPFPSEAAPSSGVAAYAKLLFARLQHNGHDVYFIADRGESAEAGDPRVLAVWDRSHRWVAQIAAVVRQLNPDVVWFQHANFLYGKGLVGAVSATAMAAQVRRLRIPLVVEMHDVRSLREIDAAFVQRNKYRLPARILRMGLRFVVRSLARSSTVLIVHEERARNALESDYGVASRHIAVVPHLLFDVKLSDRTTARRLLGLPDDRTILLFFGYASAYKGLDELFRAMESVNATLAGKRVFLLMVSGKNPHLANDRGYLECYTKWQSSFAGLRNARWDGFVAESRISLYFSAADGVILPYTEVFASSGPVMRALSYSKPALLSRMVAPPEFPSDLTFEPRDVEIARAIGRFVEDENFRQLLQLSVERSRQEYEKATGYEQVLDICVKGC